MGKYKKCPRCELNYILSEEDLCPVCKAELKLAPALDDDDLELCTICGKNLITVDQVMCDECARKRNLDDVVDEVEGDQEDDELSSLHDYEDEVNEEEKALNTVDSEPDIDDTPEGFSAVDDFDDEEEEEEEDDLYHGEEEEEDDFDLGDIDDIDLDDDDEEEEDDDLDDDGDFLKDKKKNN
ncbi:MAG: hypothetical protein IJS74_00990 [Clostridia bacterium]|nr:hypothetical protein [Clostridia bacterium]